MRIPIQSVTPDCGSAEVCGWVHEVRDLGGLAFMLIRDRTGIIQVTIPKKKVSEAVLAAVKAVSRESVVRVTGPVKAIDKAPGGRELVPETLEIISLAETPLPLDVSEKVSAEMDTRLDSRFLDVRRPRVAAVFEIRSAATHAIHQYFHDAGFTNITTPKIVAAATEGGTELFPIAYFDKEAFLNQSPQLYKQMMMSAGCEKVYEIGPIFRAEEHNTTKHLNEATSIDIEVSFADHLEVMRILEDLIVKTYAYVDKKCSAQLGEPRDHRLRPPESPVPPAVRTPRRSRSQRRRSRIRSSTATTSVLQQSGRSVPRWATTTSSWTGLPRSGPTMRCRYQNDPSICKAFDLMHPRMELSSGAQREHRYDRLVKQIAQKGLNPESFDFYLRPFRYGCPPTRAGALVPTALS